MLAVSVLDRRDAETCARLAALSAECGPPGPGPNPYSADPVLSALGMDLLRCLIRHVSDGTAPVFLSRVASGRLQVVSPNPAFSVSVAHSGDLVAAALCDQYPVGIDVQKQDGRKLDDLVDAVLCPVEREQFERDGRTVFFDTWTRREAALKAVGQSILTVREIETEDGCLMEHRGRHLLARNIESAVPGYSIAVAVALAQGDPVRPQSD